MEKSGQGDPNRRKPAKMDRTYQVEFEVGGERITANVAEFVEAKAGADKPEKSEDIMGQNGNTFVLADGSTPKKGNAKEIDGMSGGRIAANLVTQTVLESTANGRELVDEVTAAMQSFYEEHAPQALTETQATFATTLVAARVVAGERGPALVVTQVGDTSFRINGQDIYTERRRMDEIDAAARAAEIERLMAGGLSEEEAVPLGRKAIQESLNEQHRLWNNADSELGFAYVNGHHVPDEFVQIHTFELSKVRTLEFFSDGYPLPGQELTVESWEEAYRHVEAVDPNRYKEFPATKPKDDRSVQIIRFSQNS